jgi:hypothetical protein
MATSTYSPTATIPSSSTSHTKVNAYDQVYYVHTVFPSAEVGHDQWTFSVNPSIPAGHRITDVRLYWTGKWGNDVKTSTLKLALPNGVAIDTYGKENGSLLYLSDPPVIRGYSTNPLHPMGRLWQEPDLRSGTFSISGFSESTVSSDTIETDEIYLQITHTAPLAPAAPVAGLGPKTMLRHLLENVEQEVVVPAGEKWVVRNLVLTGLTADQPAVDVWLDGVPLLSKVPMAQRDITFELRQPIPPGGTLRFKASIGGACRLRVTGRAVAA